MTYGTNQPPNKNKQALDFIASAIPVVLGQVSDEGEATTPPPWAGFDILPAAFNWEELRQAHISNGAAGRVNTTFHFLINKTPNTPSAARLDCEFTSPIAVRFSLLFWIPQMLDLIKEIVRTGKLYIYPIKDDSDILAAMDNPNSMLTRALLLEVPITPDTRLSYYICSKLYPVQASAWTPATVESIAKRL